MPKLMPNQIAALSNGGGFPFDGFTGLSANPETAHRIGHRNLP
jgi:hypothetical protein